MSGKGVYRGRYRFSCGNSQTDRKPVDQAVTQAMLSWLSAYYKPVLHWSGREDTTLLEHGRIVDLLEEKNVPGAVKLMGDHLNRSAPLYDCK